MYGFVRSLRVKSAIGILYIISIISILGWHTINFNTKDQVPALMIIDAAKQKEFGAFTVKVKTGLFIKNFPGFDIIKNSFLVDCLVWFELFPDEIMLNTVQKFTFNNGKIIQKSSPDIKMENGKVIVTYDVRVECKSNLRYDRFPFEDHRITLMLMNNFVTPSEMFFEVTSNAFKVAQNIFISNWKIRDIATDSGYNISKLGEDETLKEYAFPMATFTINFQKTGFRKVLIIFLPLFFAIIFSFLSLLMNPKNNIGRYSASVSGVTSLIGYRFVIEQMMPDVGYFTLADTIYIILLSVALIIFIFQIFYAKYFESIQMTDPKEEATIMKLQFLNDLVFIIVGLLLIVIIAFVMW